MNKHLKKFWEALKDAYSIFKSAYGGKLSDKIAADLYEKHLSVRKQDKQFIEFQTQAAEALATAGHISSDWLNTYIGTIVPQENIDELIEEVKANARLR